MNEIINTKCNIKLIVLCLSNNSVSKMPKKGHIAVALFVILQRKIHISHPFSRKLGWQNDDALFVSRTIYLNLRVFQGFFLAFPNFFRIQLFENRKNSSSPVPTQCNKRTNNLEVRNVLKHKWIVHGDLMPDSLVHSAHKRLINGHALFGQRTSV